MEARLGKRMRLLMLTVQAVLALSPALALAVGEQLGRIKGRVIDDQGQPVAGATVTVEGAALIGEPRQVKTDARGRFLIQRLAPGPYQVKVVVGEEQPLLRNASVQAGDTASLRIKTTEVEVMEITGMALSTQADAAQTGVAVDAKTLNKTVIRYFGSVPANVPGVTGGSNIKGGTGRNTRWLVDGLDITGRGGNVMPFDSVKSVDVVTGGGEAQYNALGGVVNTMTADGSDEWTAKASLYLVRAWMFDRTKAGTLANSFEQPFSTTRPGRGGNYLAALRVGGPIIKDKFWFDAAYKLLQNVEPPFMASPLGVPPYNIQHPSYKYTTQGARAKLQYAPTLRHRLRLSANTSPAAWDNADRSNSRLAVAETGAARSSGFVIGAWDYLLSEDITTTLQVGVTGSRQRWGPQGRVRSVDFTGCELFSPKNCVYDPHRAQHTNLVDGTRWYQGGEDSITSQRGFQFDPSVSIHGRYYGTHDIKIGIQASADSNNVTKETPGGYTYQDRKPGAKLEDGLCDPDNPATWDACYRRTEVPSVDTTQTGYQAGLYIQDRWWTPLEWLHVMPGIRLDYGTTYASGGEQVTSFLGFGPRLGLAFDITGDGRNVISAYYGRHTEPMNLRAAQRLDESRVQTVSTWQWDSNAMAFNTLVSKSGGEGNFSVDPNAKMPHSDEITLVARRALSPSLTASAEYTYKKISNRWATVEINRIWDPTGSRIVGWVDPQKQGQTVSFYTTPDDNHTNYHGASVTLNGHPTPRLRFLGFYTLSWTYGPGGGYGNLRQRRFFDGYLGHDVRHQFRVITSYDLDYLSFGAIAHYRSGSNRTKRFYQQSSGGYGLRRSPNGTLPLTPNDISGVTEFRTPDTFHIDLRASIQVLPVKLGHKLRLHLDIFNLLNMRTATGIATADRSNFGQVTGRQTPRNFRIGMDYEF